jgi:preprotein translocase subunit YajC
MAHGGEEHVIGTVSKVVPDSITVKTGVKTTATVAVVAKTTFSTAKHAAKIADLKLGDRVVIHATEPVEGKLVADTVEFSAPKPATAPAAAAKPKT